MKNEMRLFFLSLNRAVLFALALLTSEIVRSEVVEIVAGGDHACALSDQGRIKCWGANQFGQLGIGSTDAHGDQANEMGESLPFVNLGEDFTVAKIALGFNFSCAVSTTSRVRCWGDNSSGQLGRTDYLNVGTGAIDPADSEIDFSREFAEAGELKKFVVGSVHACALFMSGKLKCWGLNTAGQLGIESPKNPVFKNESTFAKFSFAVSDVFLGHGSTTCVLDTFKRLYCIGSNLYGSLGQGSRKPTYGRAADDVSTLLPINFGESLTSHSVENVAIGSRHTCVSFSDKLHKCFGSSSEGVLGLGNVESVGFNSLDMGENLKAVAFVDSSSSKLISGYFFSCYQTVFGGYVGCWGANKYGQLGRETITNFGDRPEHPGLGLSYIDFGPLEKSVQIALGFSHACSRIYDGGTDSTKIKCWGSNRYGQLGLGHNYDLGGNSGDFIYKVKAINLGVF